MPGLTMQQVGSQWTQPPAATVRHRHAATQACLVGKMYRAKAPVVLLRAA